MKQHTPFLWPDENPARQPLHQRARAWLRDPLAVPEGAARPAPRRAHWRLSELWRTRPIPFAAALVVGIGPLAWALQDGGWDSGWNRKMAERAWAEAMEPQWGEPPSATPPGTAATAAANPAEPVAIATEAVALNGAALPGTPDAAAPGAASTPGSVNTTAADPATGATVSAATRTPQWGDPLPGATATVSGPAATPASSRAALRASEARVVLASEYFGRQPSPAADNVMLAQAPLRSGMRMRLDSPWQATRELLESVNPFVRVPRAPSVAPAPAVAAGGKALRLAELPDVIGLPLILPVSDDARQSTPFSEGLTLQQAIDMSLARNFEVKAAREKLNAARHTVRAATGSLLPQIDGRAGVGRGELDSVTPAERLARREGTLTIRQPIVDMGARREIERQKVLATAAELQYQATIGEASQEAANAYLQALQARITLAMSERYERQLARLLAQMEARASGGGASEAERNRVQARVSNARAQMAEGAATLRSAMRRLSALIGQTPQAFELARAPDIVIPSDVATARNDAARLNRELLAGRAEAVAIAYEALAHRAKMLPKLDLEVSHARATNAGGSIGYTRDTKGMLVVNWQLYNGGTDLAQQRAAQARERERGLRADDLLRRLDQELESAYAALEAVAPRFAAQREELLANASVVSAFEAQLIGGNRPLLDVLDAYQRLHSNRLELANLVINEVLSTLQVALLTGRLVPSDPLDGGKER